LLADVESSGEAPGAIRRVRTVQGQQQVEELVENPPGEHEYRYVTQRTELPVGGLPRPFDTVRQFLEAGLDNLASHTR
jgi:hypothetical protein